MIYDTVACSLRPLLNPKLTASWEMGLSRVAEGTVTEEEYMQKLNDFVARRTNHVKETDYRRQLTGMYRQIAQYYPPKGKDSTGTKDSQRKTDKKVQTRTNANGTRRKTPKTSTAKENTAGKKNTGNIANDSINTE